jgi:protein-S-isoprenylcysteine O-methyltransferase Ste14
MSRSGHTVSPEITPVGPKLLLGRTLYELLGDIFLALIWVRFACQFLTAFLAHYHPQDALLLTLECVTVTMFLTRRRATTSSSDSGDWAMALCGTMAPMFFRPEAANPTGALGLTLDIAQGFGTCVAIFGLLGLRRSFGIVPANRGVQAGGLYQYVRHPVYAGYIITNLAYTVANLNPRNIVVFIAIIVFQIIRIGNEEAHLKRDAEYREYLTRTRWRLFPFFY